MKQDSKYRDQNYILTAHKHFPKFFWYDGRKIGWWNQYCILILLCKSNAKLPPFTHHGWSPHSSNVKLKCGGRINTTTDRWHIIVKELQIIKSYKYICGKLWEQLTITFWKTEIKAQVPEKKIHTSFCAFIFM